MDTGGHWTFEAVDEMDTFNLPTVPPSPNKCVETSDPTIFVFWALKLRCFEFANGTVPLGHCPGKTGSDGHLAMPIAYCCRASATILSFQTLAY